MPEELKHAKIITHTPLPDGTIEVQTDSYHELPSGYKQEIMKHVITSHATFLSDLIECVGVLTSQKTRELTITISTDEHYMPKQITRIYTVKKEVYKKR